MKCAGNAHKDAPVIHGYGVVHGSAGGYEFEAYEHVNQPARVLQIVRVAIVPQVEHAARSHDALAGGAYESGQLKIRNRLGR